MKFVVIGPTWPFRGGIAHYTTLLVKHLRERNHVRFITYKKQYPGWLYPGNVEPDPSPDESALKVDCDRVLTPWSVLTWWRAYRLIRAEQPDALVLQWWTPFWSPMLFFLTRMLTRATPKSHQPRIIFLCHHVIPPEGGMLDWLLARRIIWRSDGFVVMSEEDFALMRRALPWARVKVVPHPPYNVFGEAVPQPTARRKLGLPDDAPTLLFFGFVRRYKGLRFLIEAMPAVREKLPGARLIVAGEFWEDEAPYHAWVEQLGLGEAVRFFSSYIPNDEVNVYFSACDVVVMPYLDATQSGVAQIAISFDKPMIATAVGGMAETVRDGETGFIVPPGDNAALADAVIRFFARDHGPAFADNVRASKDSAPWERLVKVVEELAAEPDDRTARPNPNAKSPRIL